MVANFPGLIAGSYVLHRLLVPRHPPCALSSLSCYKDARVHCVVLKLRAVPPTSLRLPNRPITAERKQFAGAMARRDRSLDPSGPNSVLGQPLDASSDFHAGEPTVLTRTCLKTNQIIDVPLVSIVCRRTGAYATDSWTAVSPRTAKCSLERR